MSKARDIRRRIRSIQSTRQITHTMEMVAASKLRRAQERVRAARPYAAKLAEVISGLFAPELAETYPMLRQPEGVRRSALVLLTSNRGLAGGFNVNLIREARGVLDEFRADGVDVEFHVVGRRGINFFQFRREPMKAMRQDISDRPSMEDARSLIDALIPRFESGELDAIDIVYAHFKHALSTPPTRMRVLPISPPDDSRRARSFNYLFAPSAEEILTFVLPLYVRNAVYRALVESAAAEQGARMTAMKNATDNADELVKSLTLQYNKARQAQITQELTEITGGAEAQRGQ
ncbi:MAG: ATP synthase F1 subunit gamma [Gemmatimonadota bacterium]|nr:MAG: ATP synthase F1 subunit gamma [Gemmatimonadota bacterium]